VRKTLLNLSERISEMIIRARIWIGYYGDGRNQKDISKHAVK
jgi:hypothetical protein